MKKLAILFVFSIAAFITLQTSVYAQPYTPPQPVDTGFTFGINWSGNVGNALFSDSLGFNNFHTGDPLTPTLLNTTLPHGTFTYADYGEKNIIYPYSASQRLLYTTVPKPLPSDSNASDTLQRNYFLHMDSTIGSAYPNPTSPDHWQVDSSSDSSFSNVVVMSQNENAGEWHWLGGDSLPIGVGGANVWVPDTLLLAIRMQVPVIKGALDSDRIVASVIVQFDTTGRGSDTRYGPQETFNIMWSWFHAPNKDTCFFSPRYTVTKNFIWYFEGLGCWFGGAPCECGTEITLMSQRYVSFRVSEIVITDPTADSLLSGLTVSDPNNPGKVGYDPEDSIRARRSRDTITTKIQNAAHTVDSLLGGGFGSSGRRKWFYLLDEMTMAQYSASRRCNEVLDTTGLTEMQGDPTWNTPRYIAQVQPKVWINPWFGLSTASREAYADSTNTGITGYNTVAYDTTQRIAPYDLSAAGHANIGVATTAGGNELLMPNFANYGVRHWWADLFIYDNLDTSQKSIDGTVPTPEELSAASNEALAMGASGLWFYTNTRRGNCLGFTDENGEDSSDYHSFISGYSLPVMWHRNSLWSKNFSAWLKYANEIFPMTWKGGFIRGIIPNSDSSVTATTFNTLSIVNPTKDREARYKMSKWGDPAMDTTIHILLDTDSIPPYLVYGEFDDTSGGETKWLYTVNLYQDCRTLNGVFNKDSDAGFTQRGTRVLWTTMTLDSATSQYYMLTTLAPGFPDTIVAYNGVYRQTLLPGGASVTRIVPFCSYAERNIMSDSGNAFGNGVHEVKHADGGYRTVYVRNDTVYERKMSECGISGEKMVEPGKASNNTFEYAYTCASLFDSSRTIAADSFLFCVCANPTIAEGRSGKTDEDLLVWEEDSWYKRPTHDTIVYKTIRAIPYSYSTDMPTAPEPYMIADSMTLGKSRTFLATPVVTGTNYGYIFAWADSSKGIKVSAMMGGGGSFYYSDSICTINGLTNHQPALFPSLSWGTDVALSPTGHIIFAPSAHLVWQQPDSQNVNEIWHMTIDVFFTDETECTWFGENPIEQVSDKNAWWCDNTMPCVSADGQDSTSGIMGTKIPSKNTAHIVWHAYILNDTINANRICYRNREFHYGQSYYSPTFIFASGIEQFFEPSIYVPPVPKVLTAPATIGNFVSVVNVCWFASHDAYVNHDSMKIATSSFAPGWSSNYPFFTSFGINNYIRSYPLLGLHPTLSYSLANDVSPSTVSQSGLSQYQLQSTEYGTFISDTNYSNALLNSVVIHPQKNSYTSGGCSNWSPQVVLGTTQIIGSEPDYFGLPPVQPISIAQEIDGNGVIENTLVRTVNLILAPEVPLVISRAIGARDAGVNTALLSTGHSVELLIELVDSVGDVPLKTLDSFLITTPSDTGWRTGTISYMPDLSFVGFPVYVRARIIADTNAARWNVLSMNELAPDTLNDGGGFAKPLRTTNGVPAGLDSIGLTLYPNPATPANPNTRIMYSVGVEDANNVTELKIYNMIGEDVTTLFSGVKAAGRYAVTFYASDQLPSGEYIVTVREQTHTESKLLIITK